MGNDVKRELFVARFLFAIFMSLIASNIGIFFFLIINAVIFGASDFLTFLPEIFWSALASWACLEIANLYITRHKKDMSLEKFFQTYKKESDADFSYTEKFGTKNLIRSMNTLLFFICVFFSIGSLMFGFMGGYGWWSPALIVVGATYEAWRNPLKINSSN